ncbi:MAG: hypothetical protein HYZ07_02390 [Candidatus Harrisonbacteria bacterium]|nr:hypothetical protein [Candidatus Harrisonbacteria bacterium]
MDNNQQNFGGGAMGNMPPKPLSNNQPPFPPLPAEALAKAGRPIPPPPIPPRPAVASGEGGPRPTPPPPPPPMRDFQHVAPVAPSGGAPSAPPPLLPPEVKTPPPPGPDVNIRSLRTDTESLAAGGGAAPQAQTIPFEELEDETPFAPETASELPEGVALPSRAARLALIVGGSVLGVALLGIFGYYIVYPLLFTEAPSVEPLKKMPVAKVEARLHASLFTTAPPFQAELALPAIHSAAIFAAMSAEAQRPAPANTVKELALSDTSGQAPFSAFFNTLVPDITAQEIADVLEDDFTGFLYYDEQGVWPGYVAALKPTAIPSDAQATFAKLESADITVLYLEDVGVKGEFKSGQLSGVPTRYATFQKPGASFNYGIFGNYLVLSTSFDGLKVALPFLGL